LQEAEPAATTSHDIYLVFGNSLAAQSIAIAIAPNLQLVEVSTQNNSCSD
jgi:hypothetical protein